MLWECESAWNRSDSLRKPVLYPAELRDRALNTWIIEGCLATPPLDPRARSACGRAEPPPLRVKASRAATHRATAGGRRLGPVLGAHPLSAAIAQLKKGDPLVHGLGLLLERFGGRGVLLDQRRVLLRDLVHLAERLVDLLDPARLLQTRIGDI